MELKLFIKKNIKKNFTHATPLHLSTGSLVAVTTGPGNAQRATDDILSQFGAKCARIRNAQRFSGCRHLQCTI